MSDVWDFDNYLGRNGVTNEYVRQLEVCGLLSLPVPNANRVFKSWKPSIKTLQNLQFAISFVKEHKRVTVRQLYYGLVSQGYPNNIRNYHKVINMLTRARLSGIIPFDSVIDDTREAEKSPSWDSMGHILTAAIHQFRSDWWRDQPNYVEVWLEKRALKRIFYPITNGLDVHLCCGGGYQSWSQIWEARNRFSDRPSVRTILYFGDLDPSGKDMPRDIQERFNLLGVDVEVREIALTKEDVEHYNLPPNPMKMRDSRNRWYVEKYGIDYAVELDALPPDILKQKIVRAISSTADMDLLETKHTEDQIARERWEKFIEDYNGHKDDLEG